MADTSVIYARIDTNLKESAESILSKLGISPSSAIQMLYSQVVLTKSMPLDLHLPTKKPVAMSSISKKQLEAELMKGLESIKSDRTYTADEVDTMLAQEFGI